MSTSLGPPPWPACPGPPDGGGPGALTQPASSCWLIHSPVQQVIPTTHCAPSPGWSLQPGAREPDSRYGCAERLDRGDLAKVTAAPSVGRGHRVRVWGKSTGGDHVPGPLPVATGEASERQCGREGPSWGGSTRPRTSEEQYAQCGAVQGSREPVALRAPRAPGRWLIPMPGLFCPRCTLCFVVQRGPNSLGLMESVSP